MTERVEMEESLRKSEERFRLVSRATQEVIWDWDIASDTVWRNDSFATVFGYDINPTSSDTFANMLHENHRDRVMRSIHDALESDRTMWEEEYLLYRRNGDVATVMDRGIISRDSDGRAVRVVGSLRDISRRRAAELRLLKAERMEALGQFTGSIAHDFNNILTVILGSAQMIAKRSDTARLQNLADSCISAAKRGAGLTQRLLAFARRQPLAPERIDLTRTIGAMDVLLRHALPENIHLTFALTPDLPPVEIDPGELENAILNLAVNARDAMPDGGHITIETSWSPSAPRDRAAVPEADPEARSGPMSVVSVSDTGCGMTPAVLEQVFEPFFTTKSAQKGTGLGLSSVYGFVRQSGGDVRIYSEPGAGTIVRLYLPCVEGAVESGADEKCAETLRGGDEHILLAEDDPLVRQQITEILEDLGYTVTGAQDGEAALAKIDALGALDLLVSDVVMPGAMTGPMLASAVQEKRPGLPVLFISGYTGTALMVGGRMPAGVQLLSKPFDRATLARKIRDVLDG